MAIQIAPKPSRLEQAKSLLGGAKTQGIAARAVEGRDGAGLARYEAACRAIAEALSVDEVKNIRNQAEALRAAARVANNRQAEVDMAEVRIRAERRLGELMEAQRKAGLMNKGAAVEGVGKRGLEENPRSAEAPPTLAEAGIDKNLADRARKIAAIPDTEFEDIMAARRDRFQQEDERVTVTLMEAGERHSAPAETDEDREYAVLLAAWKLAGQGARDRFVELITEQPEVETHDAEACNPNSNAVDPASIRNDGRANLEQVDVDRSAERASSAVEVGAQVSPERAKKQRANVLSQHEVRPGSTSLGTEQKCDTLGVTAGETALPSRPRPVLRPHCLNPGENCGGQGVKHCYTCAKAHAESEAA